MSAYRAPYDRVVLLVTVIASIALLAATVAMLGVAAAISLPVVRVLCGALAVGILAILVFSYVLAPKGYRIEPGRLVVERPAGPLTFALDAPVEIRRADRLGPTLRTWGNGGLFGAYGRFRNKELGAFRAYSRRSHDYVVIRTPSLTLVAGPEDPDQFVHDLQLAAAGEPHSS